jgi:Flp pilus assembly protein TadG
MREDLAPRAFVANDRGAVAVEFALVIPTLMFLYLGLVSLAVGVDVSRRVNVLAGTVADLLAQGPGVSCNEVTADVAAASAILWPHDPSGTEVAMAGVAVTVGSSGKVSARVDWSAARRVTARDGNQQPVPAPAEWEPGSLLSPIPAGFDSPNTSFVIATVKRTYVPVVGGGMAGTIQLVATMPFGVRSGGLTWRGATACA